jgi:hypothetical protein
MKVTNWDKWTSAKKKMATICVGTGIFLSFGVESSMWWAVPALVLAYAGCVIINSIARDEW